MPAAKSLLDRLADKFTVGDGCWEWTASRDANGYGRVLLNGTSTAAHRVLYELLVGPVSDGLELDHLCRNRGCVRPGHLEAVSHRENMRRSPIMGTHNATKTHCPRGHPYDADNTSYRPNGARQCRLCARDRERSKRWLGGEGHGCWQAARTHCPQGHAYDDLNTYRDAKGKRHCLACMRARDALRRSRKKRG